MTPDFAPLLDFINEFGTNTDNWVLGFAMEGGGNAGIVVLVGHPHPYNEPDYSLWVGHYLPTGLSVESRGRYNDIREARSDFNKYVDTLEVA